jgi:hypothetical protein
MSGTAMPSTNRWSIAVALWPSRHEAEQGRCPTRQCRSGEGNLENKEEGLATKGYQLANKMTFLIVLRHNHGFRIAGTDMAVVCSERSKATALADVITCCVFVGTIALVSFRVIRKDRARSRPERH